MDKIFKELEEDEMSTSSLDSDDPETWGPYYWSNKTNCSGDSCELNFDKENINVSAPKKVADNLKFYTFKTYRSNII